MRPPQKAVSLAPLPLALVPRHLPIRLPTQTSGVPPGINEFAKGARDSIRGSFRGEGGFEGDFGKGSGATLDYWFE
jgi:hypothetical protein